jgi:hypothetical protein
MATAMLPLFEPAKRLNFNSVLKTQQSLHSQKLRTIVVQNTTLGGNFIRTPPER